MSEVQETVLNQNEVVRNVNTDNEYKNEMGITFVSLIADHLGRTGVHEASFALLWNKNKFIYNIDWAILYY